MSAEIGSYFHLTPEVIDIINNQLSGNLHDSPMFSAVVKDGQTVEFKADEQSSVTELDLDARFVTKSGSGTCANPGLSAPILSTPIVSTTITPLATLPRPQVTTSGALSASALRSTPISGYNADGYTACKHNFTPECTFCWNERRRLNGQSTVDTAEPYRPLATGSSRADKIRAVAQQAHDNGDCVCCMPDEMVEFERAKRETITITISRDDAEFHTIAQVITTAHERLAHACRAALEGER